LVVGSNPTRGAC